jgi:hypothetical protein
MEASANGVIQVGVKKQYYTSKDVMELLGVGNSKACQMMRSVRNEMIAKGELNPAYSVRAVPRDAFNKAFGIVED